MSDEKLIQFYLNDNPAALTTLSTLYKDRIYKTIYNIVQDKYVAEEIFRNVFGRIINNLITGKNAEDGEFLQWAIKIAQELCMEYNRNRNVVSMTAADKNNMFDMLNSPAAEYKVMYYEKHTRIKSMIDVLPDSQREVIILNHYAGLSFRDIASRMCCSVTTALDIMKTGLANLFKLMAEQDAFLRNTPAA